MASKTFHQGEMSCIDEHFQFRTHRFYMVGKLIRQDLDPPEPGYRETCMCPCHGQAVKLFGPLKSLPSYAAYCPVTTDLIAEANTMEEMWDAVAEVKEREEYREQRKADLERQLAEL